jgi:predicted RNA-binding Zn-ribbon protein involved in translation (DUF1610 family)
MDDSKLDNEAGSRPALPKPTSDSKEMKCPMCGKTSLKRKESGVICNFCGYILSPGEEVKFRLYELLKQSP